MNSFTQPELALVGVFDRGVPNQERIVIRANRGLVLTYYHVLLGEATGFGTAIPLQDHFFWFGDIAIPTGALVFLYTGPGSCRTSTMPNGELAYVFHWGKGETIFASNSIVPMLVNIGKVQVGEGPVNRPQMALKSPDTGQNV